MDFIQNFLPRPVNTR